MRDIVQKYHEDSMAVAATFRGVVEQAMTKAQLDLIQVQMEFEAELLQRVKAFKGEVAKPDDTTADWPSAITLDEREMIDDGQVDWVDFYADRN